MGVVRTAPVSSSAAGLPEEAYAAALASVPSLGPKGLRAMLDGSPPHDAWTDLRRGGGEGRRARWAREARRIDVAVVWREHARRGITVAVRGGPGYPAALAGDVEAPAVLFAIGDPLVLDRHPRVAIVGTRSATRYGLGVAADLGAELAAHGVVVVSGLALGIDGAAHEGALAPPRAAPAEEPGTAVGGPGAGSGAVAHGGSPRGSSRAGSLAPPVAVVAGDLSVPYPRAHIGLWRRVAAAGAVLSEAPIGAADIGWRFPQRNRIIAALAHVVVVVECHHSGGALHTVRAATRRGIAVGAVPGSVRSPASAGTNDLLADGCFVVRDATDVLVATGLATAWATGSNRRAEGVGDAPRSNADLLPARDGAPARDGGGRAGAVREAEDDGAASAVLDALGWERCSVEQVLVRTGLSLPAVSMALERLRTAGHANGEAGWWERA